MGYEFGKVASKLQIDFDIKKRLEDLLPPCPDALMCPISQSRMVDPVLASDSFTYERSEIEEWLGKNSTSPMTRKQMNTTLTPNQGMKTRIQEWVEENTGLNGLRKQLKAPQGSLAMGILTKGSTRSN